ncbi:MAG: hypothetical protein WC279_11790, partial [Sulfurimonas sp.]|uniref:hypothetical protein n=1 Tax=Sulfurimonas sp. TaxID=2022749 RepID=UPI00356B3033
DEATTDGLEPDAFDLAFEAAAGGSDDPADALNAKPDEGAKPAEGEEKPVEGEGKPAEGAKPAEGEGKPAEGAKPAEGEGKPDEGAKPAEPTPTEVAAAAAKTAKEVADQKAADDAAEAARKETARLAAEQRAAQEQLTPEEQAAIELADKELPEAGKAYAARERVLVARLTNAFEEKLAAIEAKLTGQIAPVAHTLATNAFESAVLKAHPDAFDVLDKVDAWKATKPAFMQKQIDDILDHAVGGAQATIDVLTLFKTETGSAQSAGPTEEEKAAAAATAADKTKKLQSQEGVQSRSTQKSAAVDPEDFDGAYEKFAATSA